jgi:DNA-binding NarL/FixJ family response regulator
MVVVYGRPSFEGGSLGGPAAGAPRRAVQGAVAGQAIPAGRGNGAVPRSDGVTTVLIVDDHVTLSGALAITLDAQPGIRCVGTATSLAMALSLVTTLQPDVILLDVVLPDGDGIDAIPSLLSARPGARVLVLTGHTDVDQLSRAAARGASGFLPKESPLDSITNAVRAAVTGQMLVDGATLAAILGRLAGTSRQPVAATGNVPELTRREADVLRLMGAGHDPHTIARMLGITINTCRGYQKSLMAKLDAHSQLEAVVIGTRLGLIGH